jgi:putative membrane-bound dehydrogenase-like protein
MSSRFAFALALSLSLVVAAIAATTQAAEPATAKFKSPISPEESLKHFVLDPGLKVELAAAEPEVVDPVTVRFDEQGRMWVAEYRDYPNGPAPGGKPLSRIKMLEDQDGDGRFETAHLFADELSFCNGLQPWRGGVIATMAGRIAYLKDTDGDHKADVFETWYTGFAEENPQLRVNHPRFGLDNKIYVANGLRGGSAVDARKPDAVPVSLKGHDLKFDPRTGAYEAIAGSGQFGLTFDDFGNRFICSNRNPLMHVVLEDRYLARNPNFAVTAVQNDVAASGEASHVFPLVEAWTTSILHAGQYTAACGVDIYRGDALPEEYYGNGFTCEPTGSLVHREVIEPAGATFSSKSPYDKREFLASRDPWFRPVFCEGGPDGALYVCDMYRAVIEHPQFMPEELKNRPDLRYGDDRGRIYRIVPKDFKRPAETAFDPAAGPDGIVALLDHPNCWWRETAQRLIFERQHPQTVRVLAAKVFTMPTPVGRVQALWTLEGLGALKPENVRAALADSDPRVREQALVLAERHKLADADVRALAVKQTADADGRLRFQAVLSLGDGERNEQTIETLADALVRSGDDPWMRAAVGTSIGDQAGALLAMVLKASDDVDGPEFEWRRRLIRELGVMAGPTVDRSQAKLILDVIEDQAEQAKNEEASTRARNLRFAALAGLGKRLKGGWNAFFGVTADRKGPDGATAPLNQYIHLGELEKDLAAPGADKELRLDVLELMSSNPAAGGDKITEDDPLWKEIFRLIRTDADGEIRAKALSFLASRRTAEVGPQLLALLPKQSPAGRGQVFDALLSRPERVKLLLDAIEAGKLKPREIDQTRANRLLKSSDPALKARAEKLLASAMPADRLKVFEDYKRVLTMAADPHRGKEVFKKNCATCHKIGDVGVEVGPSIADLRTKTPEQVLTDVIMPNKAIDNNFVSYTIVTDDGLQYVGIVAADTPGSVTLKMPDGKLVSVLKSNIDSMENNGVSLMPEGVERTIPHQDMADVIAFVKNWRYLDGTVPTAPAK